MENFKEYLKEQIAKKELEEYDIYTLNERLGKRVLRADKEKEFYPIDDIKAFIDRYR